MVDLQLNLFTRDKLVVSDVPFDIDGNPLFTGDWVYVVGTNLKGFSGEIHVRGKHVLFKRNLKKRVKASKLRRIAQGDLSIAIVDEHRFNASCFRCYNRKEETQCSYSCNAGIFPGKIREDYLFSTVCPKYFDVFLEPPNSVVELLKYFGFSIVENSECDTSRFQDLIYYRTWRFAISSVGWTHLFSLDRLEFYLSSTSDFATDEEIIAFTKEAIDAACILKLNDDRSFAANVNLASLRTLRGLLSRGGDLKPKRFNQVSDRFEALETLQVQANKAETLHDALARIEQELAEINSQYILEEFCWVEEGKVKGRNFRQAWIRSDRPIFKPRRGSSGNPEGKVKTCYLGKAGCGKHKAALAAQNRRTRKRSLLRQKAYLMDQL